MKFRAVAGGYAAATAAMTVACSWETTSAFSVGSTLLHRTSSGMSSSAMSATQEPMVRNDPLEEFSEERKQQLFQFMLRDLEIEGVPLLGCDADQIHTFQAAVWTTMAELCAQDEAGKACLVLEDIPMDVIRRFVDDFTLLKSQLRLVEDLPELERVSASLVGKGVGPAVVVEALPLARSDTPSGAKSLDEDLGRVPALESIAAQKAFLHRVSADAEHCSIEDGAGCMDLDKTAFRLSKSNICDVLATFWTSICELLSMPEDELSSTVLMVPYAFAFRNFTASCEVVSRSLFLFKGDTTFDLLHLHPAYERKGVYPEHDPAHGHLPPAAWLPPMVRHVKGDIPVNGEHVANILNYQRRSPVPAIVIERVSAINRITENLDNSVVDLRLEDGRTVKAAGAEWYTRRIEELSGQGEDRLKQTLEEESKVAFSG